MFVTRRSNRDSRSKPAVKPRPPRRGARAERVASLAKALGHPTRVGIVRLLLERQSCIGCDIVDDVGLAQSTVSEHLRILKAAGILVGESEGPRVCYSLDPAALVPLAELLDEVLAAAASSGVENAARSSAARSSASADRRRASGRRIRR